MSEIENPQVKAQESYNHTLALLKGLHGKDSLSFEIDAHEQLGHNSLQLLLNKFGQYDAGWIDEADFDDATRNKIAAFNRQDIVSTNAISKSILRKVHSIEKNIKLIKWIVAAIAMLNILLLMK